MVRQGSGRPGTTGQTYFKLAHFEALAAQIDRDLIDMAIPAIRESIPVVNATRRQSERSLTVLGLRPEDTAILEPGERIDAGGKPFTPGRLGTTGSVSSTNRRPQDLNADARGQAGALHRVAPNHRLCPRHRGRG